LRTYPKVYMLGGWGRTPKSYSPGWLQSHVSCHQKHRLQTVAIGRCVCVRARFLLHNKHPTSVRHAVHRSNSSHFKGAALQTSDKICEDGSVEAPFIPGFHFLHKVSAQWTKATFTAHVALLKMKELSPAFFFKKFINKSPTLHLTLLPIPRWSVEGLVGGVLGWGELNASFSCHFRVIKRILESKIVLSLNRLELGSIIRLW
jgi:hypothetical protein